MDKRKLTYRFHNPNSMESTYNIILKMVIEADRKKLDEALRNRAKEYEKSEEEDLS